MNSLIMTGRTDTGMVREHNEDCFLIVPESGIAMLADGMGGHLAGEVASALAVGKITHHLLKAFAEHRKARPANSQSFEAQVLVSAIKGANTAIHQASLSKPEQSGMGTAIVVTSFHDNRLTVAHVGDSYNDPERVSREIFQLIDENNIKEAKDTMQYFYELLYFKGYSEYADEFAKKYNIQTEHIYGGDGNE